MLPQHALSIILSGDYGQFTKTQLFDVLSMADDQYANDDNSFLTDAQYDNLRLFASKSYPHHAYFIGVGSATRGGKVKLPYQLGSLDQVEIGEIAEWVTKWNLHDQRVVITDKLDGTSGMLIYDTDGKLQISYSRGDGIEGADTFRHTSQMDSVPSNVSIGGLVVRGEAIIKLSNWEAVQSTVKTSAGGQYKNPRNCVSGLMNSSNNDPEVYQYIDFVAYEIIGFGGSKTAMLTQLDELGFITPVNSVVYGKELSDDNLATTLNTSRETSEYEIDGLVIDVDDYSMRSSMSHKKHTLNPAYAIKYKVADASNYAETTVVDVEWNASKHGYLKPRVVLEPVKLVGVTVTHTTGYNAKYILENNIGPGTKVAITRCGDVVPNIIAVIDSTKASFPDVEYTWTTNDNDENVDIILANKTDNRNVIINQLVDFFSKIGVPHLKEGNITTIFDHGLQTPNDIITKLTNELAVSLLGENGNKIYKGLHDRLNGIPLYKLMGAYSNTRGIGIRRFKRLQDNIGAEALMSDDLAVEDLVAIEGFKSNTAAKAIFAQKEFLTFYQDVKDFVTFEEAEDVCDSKINGMKVVFTGFRNKSLQATAEQLGATIQSSVSSKTNLVVTVDPLGNSTKLKKARDKGIPIISVDEFKQMCA